VNRDITDVEINDTENEDECLGCALLKLDEPSICLTCKRAYNSEAEQRKTLRDLYATE